MKKIITAIISVALIFLLVINFEKITNFCASFLEDKKEVIIFPGNEYTKDKDYIFVKRSDDYIPYSYQDLVDIIYSALNNSWETFTFYCPNEYTDCLNDIKRITLDDTLLSHLNNFVHPYNSFSNIKTSYDETGEITLEITRLYSDEHINAINQKVSEITNSIITKEMTLEDKLLAIHDYIINHTKYDKTRNDNGESQYSSNTAYGTLLEGYAICGGYADAMAIFLYNLGIDNYKIASEKHVWNAVYIDGKWSHLDLTWDDPLSSDGKDNLFHTYFLVTDDELFSIDEGSEDIINHTYNKAIYLEFKKNS